MKKTFLILLASLALLPALSFAADAPKPTEYELLAPIPGYVNSVGETKTTASKYIEGIFTLMIAIAGGLAVVKIIFGGIQYMSTDAIGGKSDAKNTIQQAIWGLLLAISAWLILFTINPDLVKIDLKIPTQEIRTAPTTEPGGVVVGGDASGSANPSAYALGCTTCVTLSVPHKLPMLSPTECGRDGGCGCAYPGPCVIAPELNVRLRSLRDNGGERFIVSEAFPPTRSHKAACQNTNTPTSGQCVDATLTSGNTPQNIKGFITNADKINLRAQFEIPAGPQAAARAQAIKAAGLSDSQVIIVAGITGEHFSVYLK